MSLLHYFIEIISYNHFRLLDLMLEEHTTVEFAVEATVVLGSIARGINCFLFFFTLLGSCVRYYNYINARYKAYKDLFQMRDEIILI